MEQVSFPLQFVLRILRATHQDQVGEKEAQNVSVGSESCSSCGLTRGVVVPLAVRLEVPSCCPPEPNGGEGSSERQQGFRVAVLVSCDLGGVW